MTDVEKFKANKTKITVNNNTLDCIAYESNNYIFIERYQCDYNQACDYCPALTNHAGWRIWDKGIIDTNKPVLIIIDGTITHESYKRMKTDDVNKVSSVVYTGNDLFDPLNPFQKYIK